jgi:uncharacterized protein YjbI with pentapeptide repeats
MLSSHNHIDILKSGVRNWNKWRKENRNVRPDLRGIELRRADLQKANLERANLAGADLERANLAGADLERANLQQANLQQANLNGADLQEANLNWLRFDGQSEMQRYRWEEEHQHG